MSTGVLLSSFASGFVPKSEQFQKNVIMKRKHPEMNEF
jgi:hypothetical protein